MRIPDIFKQKQTVFSLEIFPPKRTAPVDTIYNTLDELKDLNPDFISVTYGAGGNTADTTTADIAGAIKNKYHIEPLAHLTCLNSTREEVAENLRLLHSHGVENILALRGDINPDLPPKHEFRHASDLVSFIRQDGRFSVSGACYPEGHTESMDLNKDIRNMKIKVDAGCDHLVSQLFFDNDMFYNFMDKAQAAGIYVPIEAGIMPVVNKKNIERMVTLCGASLPHKFTKMMNRYEQYPIAMRDAGIAYAINQIVDLVAQGVDGIHLYTMNNPYIARKICESVINIIRPEK